MPVRNRNNGWHMTHEEEPPKGLRPLASQAVAACGYNFGAVDLYITEDGTMGVFEVNKAPGLDNYTLEAYAQGFAAIAAGTFREK
jgi:D-alanine-D-alanine ligase-like ATP-grasp enzyme